MFWKWAENSELVWRIISRARAAVGDSEMRTQYLEEHIKWFLKNHEGAIEEFKKIVKEKYGNDIFGYEMQNNITRKQEQLVLLESKTEYNV